MKKKNAFEIQAAEFWRVYQTFRRHHLRNGPQALQRLHDLLYAYGNASSTGIINKRRRWDFSGSFHFVGTIVSTIGIRWIPFFPHLFELFQFFNIAFERSRETFELVLFFFWKIENTVFWVWNFVRNKKKMWNVKIIGVMFPLELVFYNILLWVRRREREGEGKSVGSTARTRMLGEFWNVNIIAMTQCPLYFFFASRYYLYPV